MKFTLSTADCTGNAANCLYPHDLEISTPDELAAAIMKDQVFARYKDRYRNIANFLESDVIPMNCDNDHSDNPEDWLTAEKLEEIFADVDHVIFPSRHHMRLKNGKAARPKYHILFPIASCTDPVMYAAVKGALQAKYDFFDDNALMPHGSSLACPVDRRILSGTKVSLLLTRHWTRVILRSWKRQRKPAAPWAGLYWLAAETIRFPVLLEGC